MKRSINKKMMLRLAAQANEADLYGSHRIADNLTQVLTKHAAEGLVRDEDTGYTYSKEELVKDVESMMWDAATRVFDYYDELPDGRDIEDFISTFTSEYMSGIDNIVHNKVGKHEEETPGEERIEGAPDEVVHWEIKFVPDEDADEDDIDEERSAFVLENLEEEKEEKEDEDEEEDEDEDEEDKED
jgi:hypothetical protein